MLPKQSSYFCPTQVVLGEGCFRQLSELLEEYQAQSILFVLDPALREMEFVKEIMQEMDRADMKYAVHADVSPDPKDTEVAKALETSESVKADLVLGIGGGSALDLAKAVAIVSTNGGRIHDYNGIRKFSTPPLPLIALPTTAGTGSEVSGSCVISDTQSGLKMSIRHAELNPARVAILDPLVLASLPASVACHSGLDAFVHAFESYISRNSNPITDGVNLHAIRLISENIRPFVANRTNTQAALNMLCGSNMAGMTFGQTGLGNVHCMARFIGARYHLPHGLSNALCLPVVARFNMISSPERYAQVAKAMGCPTEGLSVLEAAGLAVEAIEQMCSDLEIPQHLAEMGVKEEDIDELAELCAGAGYDQWNPRTTTKKDFFNLFKAAF